MFFLKDGQENKTGPVRGGYQQEGIGNGKEGPICWVYFAFIYKNRTTKLVEFFSKNVGGEKREKGGEVESN
jgi:hypothetical protein